jgi:hypothetical protein
VTKDEIRYLLLNHGFAVQEGQEDLKDYVYDAAYALIATVRDSAAEICVTMERKYDESRNRYEDGLYDAAMILGARIRATL